MAMVPQLIFSRAVEEDHLRCGDGSCKSVDCQAELLGGLRGKKLPLLDRCVLCCRFDATKLFNDYLFHRSNEDAYDKKFHAYVNMEGDYGEEFYLDKGDDRDYHAVAGPFVEWSSDHYRVVEGGGIVQLFPQTRALNWFEVIFTSKHVDRSVMGRWFMVVCENLKCKLNILSFVNTSYAEGFDHVVFDLNSSKLCCEKCGDEVTKVYSHEIDGEHMLVKYKNTWFSRCFYCRTIVQFNKRRSPSTCDACHEKFIESAVDSLKVCQYCKNPVTLSRRGGTQMLSVENDTLYLCRQHRLRAPNKKYSLEEFNVIMKK